MSRFKAQNMWEKMTKEGKSMAEKDATIDKWDYNNRHSKTAHQEKAIKGKVRGIHEIGKGHGVVKTAENSNKKHYNFYDN